MQFLSKLARSRARISAFSAVSAAALLSFAPANAEEADGATGVLEEIVVTASRRGTSDILTTPLSITALDGEDVEKYAIRDLNDIAVSVPGLSSGTVSAFKSAQFAMRGVSETTIILYKESPVGVTLDDFVVPHIQTSNLEMFDIERVEVLRGPQGTLFGKNTTGGVINVRTKRPVLGENSVDVRAQLGEFGTRKGNIALNLAAGENLAFRFAGMQLDSDGYYENNATFGPLGAVAPVDPAYSGLSGRGDGSDLGGDEAIGNLKSGLIDRPSTVRSTLRPTPFRRANPAAVVDNGGALPAAAEKKACDRECCEKGSRRFWDGIDRRPARAGRSQPVNLLGSKEVASAAHTVPVGDLDAVHPFGAAAVLAVPKRDAGDVLRGWERQRVKLLWRCHVGVRMPPVGATGGSDDVIDATV